MYSSPSLLVDYLSFSLIPANSAASKSIPISKPVYFFFAHYPFTTLSSIDGQGFGLIDRTHGMPSQRLWDYQYGMNLSLLSFKIINTSLFI